MPIFMEKQEALPIPIDSKSVHYGHSPIHQTLLLLVQSQEVSRDYNQDIL